MRSKNRPAPAANAAVAIACAVSIPLFTTSTAMAQDAVQWRVEDGGNGHWYAGVSGMISWNDAFAAASDAGGMLATFSAPGEFDFVATSLLDVRDDLFFQDWGPHVGCVQDINAPDYAEPRGGWSWIDGGSLLCVNSLCDNIGDISGDQHHLAIWRGFSNYGYNDTNDAQASPAQPGYLVEWSADCNNDGIVDYGQILDGTFPDENQNGVPDPCEQPGGFDGILDVPSEYPTIQSAIDAAPEGAVVRMAPGTFVENLVIGSRSIRLVGSGAHQTVLDGNATLPVVRVTDVAELEIHNLRITNGKRTGDQILGGGISAEGVKLILIEDCLIDGNKSDYQGGGLASMNVGMTVVRRTIFTNNLAGPNGGCCGASGGAAVIRGLGGGGPCLGGSSALFEDCLFVRNLAQTNNGLSSLGGAIQHTAAQDGSLHVRR
ncbi:MAG: hypothetical protein RLZZ461_33, partial [Planctomycetota bacterium]